MELLAGIGALAIIVGVCGAALAGAKLARDVGDWMDRVEARIEALERKAGR